MTAGLVARSAPPSEGTRLAILRDKASRGGVRLSAECLQQLAARPVTSVRDLLSGLIQGVARGLLLRRPITPELVTEALRAVEVPGRRHSIEEIRALVARTYALTDAELRSRSRKRRVVRPRQFAMYLCRRYTDASLKDIARAFGRDHSSVLYAVDVVEQRIVEQPQLRYELEALAARFSPGDRTSARSTRGTRRT